ncbi:anthranilate phosphoribosyltransferase [Actinomadura meridiana]|uniref:Anthranilate phosphoribosyltransferase n=1 Tax=Actinomadura meridiana TaxID=559626 RepID=A0ABP8CFJ6_9ACTN
MRDLLADLVSRDRPVDAPRWHAFWDRLRDGRLRRGDVLAVSAALSTRRPGTATVVALVSSLRERAGEPPAAGTPGSAGPVNIVGSGGGPSTFNVSTAAALVAAAMGVPVLKTGSHAYTSRHGSFDLLEKLGIPRADSHTAALGMLENSGIAFADYFVYPEELRLLSAAVLPHDMRRVGRLFNTIGPFLAVVPVSAQVVGVADPEWDGVFRELAEQPSCPPTWLCGNDLGVDELVSFTDNRIRRVGDAGADAAELKLVPDDQGFAPGSMADLAPVADGSALVPHFLSVLGGDGPIAAVQTVAFNAAALAAAAGTFPDLSVAVASALDTIKDGAAVRLVERLRDAG